MKKLNYKKISAICIVFITMMILQRASISYHVLPVAQSFAFALCYNSAFPFVTCIQMFISSLIMNFSVSNFICSSTCAAVLLIYCLVQRFAKAKKLYICIMFYVFSMVANIYYAFYSINSLLIELSKISLGIFMFFVFHRVINAYLSRGIQGFSVADKTYFLISFAVFCSGLAKLQIFSFDISQLLALSMCICFALAFEKKAVAMSFMISIGLFMHGFNIQNQVIIFSTICLGQLFCKNKYLLCAATVFCSGLLIFVSKQTFIMLLPSMLSSVITACIPTKLYKQLGIYIFGTNNSYISQYLVQNKSLEIKNKLMSMSMMFDQIQNYYKSVIASQNDQSKTNKFFADEIKNKMCSSCINYLRCYDGKDMTEDIEYLLERATIKGKVSLLDVPNLLASNCTKLNSCIANINSQAELILEKQEQSQKITEEKLVTSLQYAGISNIFRELGSQFETKLQTNAKKSALIKEKAKELGLVCKECIALEDVGGVYAIYMAVRNVDTVNPLVFNACQSQYKLEFEKAECKPTKYSGWSIIKLVPSQKYELVCGAATHAQTNDSQNGDNYIFSKISSSKYLFAIADGMGHGESANSVSNTAISLLETFYKCGFSDTMVASNINQMLIPLTSGFSSIDISVVDTKNCFANFIKLGSSISIVKKHNQSYIVDVNSLPAGALESATPTIQTVKLDEGDIVVVASDGIIDSFGEQAFCDYINTENAINMQFYAEEILQEAVSRTTNHTDDMTVLCYKIAKKR